MSGWHRTVPGGLFSLAMFLGFALGARAEPPTWNQEYRPASPCKPVATLRDGKPAVPFAQPRIMMRQIGFEAQQQGYVSKVQGAASQNVIWVTPEEKPREPSRTFRLASWRELFSFWE
ncbi:MAG TPA: hypothetical protein VMG10_06020 [Gemmataceae bacterium]|nr:hypothetical protein [Gemmataceae bacterium]